MPRNTSVYASFLSPQPRPGLKNVPARLGKKIKALRTRNARLEARIARLCSTRAVLSKALFGSKSERQKQPGTGRKRGQQRGAPGHGRTRRPGLGEKTERRNPPKDARVCSCCGKPYVANGERSTTVIEIEVKAHTRRIVRPRWRRGCDCASSPLEVTAPPVPRLFPGTPYGTSVWARFLFEHSACLRPLSRIAAWLADQGLPVSPGTLADSLKRFVPLFEPLAGAILAHQNRTAVRHADETGWRVQEFCEQGRVEPRLAVDLGRQRRGLLIGIGGRLTAPPLPHHRAYGSRTTAVRRIKRSVGGRGTADRVG